MDKDTRNRRPGVSQIGEAQTGNLARFSADGMIEDSGTHAEELMARVDALQKRVDALEKRRK